MNEQDQKLLTEKMGECWHEPDSECALGREYNGGEMIKQKCLKCGCLLSTTYQIYEENRTFDNRDDMMDLYQAIEKAGKWDDFDNYSWNYRKGVKPEISHTTWLFCLSGEGYEDRCKMVAEFWGENESTPSR